MDPQDRDKVDQALHFLMGVAMGLSFTVLLLWWREFRQQAPIERIGDTGRDIRFSLIGVTVGQVALVGLVWGLL